MSFFVLVVSLAILFKWLLQAAAFIFSGFWFSRKKAKMNRSTLPNTAMVQNNLNHTVLSGKRKKNFRFIGKYACGIMRLVNGINKFSNYYVSVLPSHCLRNFIYRNCFKIHIEKNVVIYKGVVFRDGYKCKIGSGTIIGDDNLIDARGGVEIGSNCNFSTGVRIWTAQHDLQDEHFAYETAPVKIGSRCWISSGVTILPGVSIGDGCVVASGAVVTKDCESFGVYGGVPAKKIGDRNRNIQYHFTGDHDLFL